MDKILDIEKRLNTKLHCWFKRDLLNYDDLHKYITDYMSGNNAYIYLNVKIEENMTLNNALLFTFASYLQELLDIVVIINMDDINTYLESNISMDSCYLGGFNFATDIISCGFNPNKTYIYSHLDNMNRKMYRNAIELVKITNKSFIDCVSMLPMYNFTYAKIFDNRVMHCFNVSTEYQTIIQGEIINLISEKKEWLKPLFLTMNIDKDICNINMKMNYDQIKEHILNLNIDQCFTFLKYLLENDEEYKLILYEKDIDKAQKCLINILTQFINDHKEKKKHVDRKILMYYYAANKSGITSKNIEL